MRTTWSPSSVRLGWILIHVHPLWRILAEPRAMDQHGQMLHPSHPQPTQASGPCTRHPWLRGGCTTLQVPWPPSWPSKVSAAQLQPVIDSAASRLQPWCAKLLNHGGRTILVQTTLCAIPIHAMMSLDISPKVLEALLRICRAFLWKGRLYASGGHCLMAWDKVASPKRVGEGARDSGSSNP
jgi:hypothetical protein